MTAALGLKGSIDILVIGYKCQTVAEEAQQLTQVQSVLCADAYAYEHQLAENSAELAKEIGKNYDYILAAATTFGKNLLPRIAALLDVSMLSDVTHIVSADTFASPHLCW